MIKLNRDQFAIALNHGRGTALMHVLAHGLTDVEDLVLRACMDNQAYDRQCEGQRADWLYAMFKGAPTYSLFSKAIVAALKNDDDDDDTSQLCELASLMARDGDSAAAQALRDFVRNQPNDDITGGHAIVALDGVPAALALAHRLGRFLEEHPQEFIDSLDYLTEGTPFFDEAFSELKRQATEDRAIAVYVAKEQARIEETLQSEAVTDEQRSANSASYREKVRREYTVDGIIAAASGLPNKHRHYFSRFGRFASEEDLNRILQHLGTESDPDTCLRLLWVFSRAEMPQWDARVWELANDGVGDLRSAARRALSSMCDPRIGELARQRLRGVHFSVADADVIELLELNYSEGDDELILAALERLTPDADEAHWIEMGVRKVCIENKPPKSAELAAWIYRTNPCTICRRTAIELMLDAGPLPEEVANEFLHEPKR